MSSLRSACDTIGGQFLNALHWRCAFQNAVFLCFILFFMYVSSFKCSHTSYSFLSWYRTATYLHTKQVVRFNKSRRRYRAIGLSLRVEAFITLDQYMTRSKSKLQISDKTCIYVYGVVERADKQREMIGPLRKVLVITRQESESCHAKVDPQCLRAHVPIGSHMLKPTICLSADMPTGMLSNRLLTRHSTICGLAMTYSQPRSVALPTANGAMGAASPDHWKHGDVLQSEEIQH
jgi:hypothetical protein